MKFSSMYLIQSLIINLNLITLITVNFRIVSREPKVTNKRVMQICSQNISTNALFIDQP